MSEPSNIIDLSGLLEKIHELDIEIARLQEQKEARDIALIIARDALKHNQEASNEWRKENIDQRTLFTSKTEFFGVIDALTARVAILERDASAIWIRALVISGAIIGAVAALQHFWK